jgi:AAA+ superfamily predicted ATPase
MLLHMVFKVARTMAPSVILIDEAEKVFISDKKRLKEMGGQVGEGRARAARGLLSTSHKWLLGVALLGWKGPSG